MNFIKIIYIRIHYFNNLSFNFLIPYPKSINNELVVKPKNVPLKNP